MTPNNPTAAAAMPPMSIQMALSVGDPVKNLETSELKEFVAWIPKMMSATPPTSRAIEMSLFMSATEFLCRVQSRFSLTLFPPNRLLRSGVKPANTFSAPDP
jgi:hypothetical protein